MRRILDLLRLVVVFDFHLLGSAMLRLRLRRLQGLRGLAPEQDIRVVCQSEQRHALRTAVRNTFAPLSTADFRDFVLAASRPAVRDLVVWRNDEPTLRLLAGKELGRLPPDPVEVAPLATLPARRPAFAVQPAFLDTAGRWDRAVWDRVVAGNFITDSTATFPPPDARCIVVEDRGNLIDAVMQHRNFHGVDRSVLMVVSHRYALRDWFLWLLRQELAAARPGGTGEDDRARSGLPRSMAPDPKGGLTEIATVLAAEFRTAGRDVPQRRVGMFLAEAEKATVDAFGLFPTSAGVYHLFERETGQGLAVQPVADRFHEISFRLPEGIAPPRPPVLSAPVTGLGEDGFHLAPGDHGLSYAERTTLHSGGSAYVVTRVENNGRRVAVAGAPPPQGQSRNAYLFHRQYLLGLAPDRAAVEAGGELTNVVAGIDYRLAVLRGEVQRRTAATATIDETATPFSSHVPPSWRARDIRVAHRDAAMLLWRLELGMPDSQLLGGERSAETAFTLAATLQDVLASLFPLHAHRLAVLSPQAAPCVEALVRPAGGGPVSDIDRFPADLYPRLVGDFPALDNPRLTPPAPMEEVQARIAALLRGRPRDASRPDTPAGMQVVDLILVEDADHDLGVVGAVFTNWDRIVEVWISFIHWLFEDATTRTAYYRFGGPALSRCFAFEETFRAINQFAPRRRRGGE